MDGIYQHFIYYHIKSVQKRRVIHAGYLSLCMVLLWMLAGCGNADRALSVPVEWAETDSVTDQIDRTQVTESAVRETDSGSMTADPGYIFVYVCGAVWEPQVVELPDGSRARDALEAAGGFAENADRNAVNLAVVLSDGQKLYFPTEEESWSDPAGQQTTGLQDGGYQSSLVNINTADVTALCTLPGIGQSRAEAIVTYRQQNGAFASIEDIMKVSGIKEGAFEKIKGLITVR